MNIFTMFLAVLVGIVTVSGSAIAPRGQIDHINGRFTNSCGFTVYVRQAVAEHPGVTGRETFKCAGFGETYEVALPPHGVYWTPRPTYMDSCGHSIKVARSPGGPVYQYEFNWALEDKRIWYNLSHNSGNPFTDVARQIGGPQASLCKYLRCEPGNNGQACDDPLAGDCETIGVINAYLC